MDMAESHVVSALANKRAEIAGMIARTQQQLGQFRADLVHLDATIRLFAPAMEPETIPAKRIRQSDPWFERGELSRRVLNALRRASVPIRAPDLVRAVMIDNGLDPADRASFVHVQWKVRDTLNRLVWGFLCQAGFLRYHGAFTPSAWLTSYRLADDNHLDRCEIEDGYGGKSRRVGAGQQAGRDCRHDRPSPAADRPISRRSGSSGCDHPSVCSDNGAGDDPGEEDPPI
ncbi:MAG TPA: hypothetical protein VKI44_16080 [Acetobacteraceae bacterium]|nr:hypothetical protein [Acetobacteraceae bacterium]